MKNRIDLVRRTAFLAAISIGGGLLSSNAMAYETDTHFIMTMVQCQAAGMTSDDAFTVARYDQGMDDSPGTLANGGVGGMIPNTDEEQLWHAIPMNASLSFVLNRKKLLFDRALAQPDKENQLKRLGVFFHFQQDTWAHRKHPNSSATSFNTYSVPFGHAFDGHQPDRPPFDPVCALRCLEEGVGFARRFVKEALKGTPSPLFDGYVPATGKVDTNWSDSRNGKFFHQIKKDNSTPARKFLTDLIHSQINAYESSLDMNPNFAGRITADEADFNTARKNILGACTRAGLTITVPLASARRPIATLTTTQMGEKSLGTKSYKIVVKTGTRADSGTDANIFVSIKGSKGTISPQNLETFGHNDFENGQTDTFYLNGFIDIGEIESITLRNDNSGLASGWFCDYVEVSAAGMSPIRFTCNDWLEKPNLSRTLMKPGLTSNYRIVVKTGDVSGAGTDANIFLTIQGTKGTINNRELDSSGHNDFERNQTDVYNLNGFPDIGEIVSITIRSDDAGLGSGWFLSFIQVTSSKTSETVKFIANTWIEKPHLTKTIHK